jgi:NAD-dependent dihydropyrimidine dehydrogenase PreA subunit
MSAKDAYDSLVESVGFPGSARLRRVLENLMTPQQAQMAAALPAAVAEVAEKTGFPEDEVRKALDDLFSKGVAFPRGDFVTRDYYRFARNITQLHDASMATKDRDVVRDREFYELWYDFIINEMYPDTAERLKQAQSPLTRVVPAYKSIKDLPDVLPCENFPEMLKAQEVIAVVPCSCRYCTTAVGEHCERTSEEERWNCLQFGRGAEYVIKRDSGRQLSTEEALELCEKVEEDGLLHQWPNTAMMTGINTSCQCCRDCCMIYVPIDQARMPVGKVWQKSRYQAYMVDLDACDGCQDCVERCQFDAVTMAKVEGSRKLKASIIEDNCFGCGSCVVGCEPAALKMKVVQPPEFIPGAVA